MNDLPRAAILLLVLSVALGMPGMLGMDDAVVAKPDSGVWANMWLSHAVAKAFVGGGPPLSANPDLAFPGTVNLWPYLNGVLWPILMSPFYLWVGPVFAHNLSGILALFLTSLCAYLFFRKVCGDHAPALICAIIYGSFIEPDLGDPNLCAFFTVPLSALFMVRLNEKPRAFSLFAGSLIIGVSFYMNIYFGLVSLMFGLMNMVPVTRKIGCRKTLLFHGGSLLLGLLVAAPILFILMKARVSAPAPALFGERLLDIGDDLVLSMSDWMAISVFLTTLLLSIVGKYRAQKGYLFWLLSALIYLVSAVCLCYLLVKIVFNTDKDFLLILSSWLGGPILFTLVLATAGMCLCFLSAAAITIRRLLKAAEAKQWPHQLIGRIAIAVVVAVTVLAAPSKPTSASIPPAYKFLMETKAEGALMETPVICDMKKTEDRLLFYQLSHRRRIVSGPTLPGYYYGLSFANGEAHGPLFESLSWCANEIPANEMLPFKWPEGLDYSAAAKELFSQGVAFVMVHNREPHAMKLNWLSLQAFGQPIYQDDTESLYKVGRQ